MRSAFQDHVCQEERSKAFSVNSVKQSKPMYPV